MVRRHIKILALAREAIVTLSLLITFTLWSPPASSEGFEIERWRGHKVLSLTGPIYPGLSRQLERQAPQADVWEHGAPVLLLDSWGGDVGEAFKIAEIIQRLGIGTVIPNGAVCSSACASIIFIAGATRIVEANGLMGQHSCSVRGLPNSECNEEIASHAVANGVPYGSVAAFINYTSPDDISYLDRETVDGYGISRYFRESISGYERSDPLVVYAISGLSGEAVMPAPQSSWRIDFFGDGYRAFVRTVSDFQRAGQINFYCQLSKYGCFVSVDIPASLAQIEDALKSFTLSIDGLEWTTLSPSIEQIHPSYTSISINFPQKLSRRFFLTGDALSIKIELEHPYDPIVMRTFLASSRPNLAFAANNPAS